MIAIKKLFKIKRKEISNQKLNEQRDSLDRRKTNSTFYHDLDSESPKSGSAPTCYPSHRWPEPPSCTSGAGQPQVPVTPKLKTQPEPIKHPAGRIKAPKNLKSAHKSDSCRPDKPQPSPTVPGSSRPASSLRRAPPPPSPTPLPTTKLQPEVPKPPTAPVAPPMSKLPRPQEPPPPPPFPTLPPLRIVADHMSRLPRPTVGDSIEGSLCTDIGQRARTSRCAAREVRSRLSTGKHISVFQLNIGSQQLHHKNLLKLLHDCRTAFSLILICETWMKEHAAPHYPIRGYTGHHLCRTGGRGGGLALYVADNQFKGVTVEGLPFQHSEALFFVGKCRRRTVSLLFLYRPPHSHPVRFVEELCSFLSTLPSDDIILAGDFNLNITEQKDKYLKEQALLLLFQLGSLGFNCEHDQLTRPSRGGGSCLDLFFTNFTFRPDNVLIPDVLIADHFPVVMQIALPEPEQPVMR